VSLHYAPSNQHLQSYQLVTLDSIISRFEDLIKQDLSSLKEYFRSTLHAIWPSSKIIFIRKGFVNLVERVPHDIVIDGLSRDKQQLLNLIKTNTPTLSPSILHAVICSAVQSSVVTLEELCEQGLFVQFSIGPPNTPTTQSNSTPPERTQPLIDAIVDYTPSNRKFFWETAEPDNTGPFSDPKGAASTNLLNNLRVFWQMKKLPRHSKKRQPSHNSGGVGFVNSKLLPLFADAFGGLPYFWRCLSSIKAFRGLVAAEVERQVASLKNHHTQQLKQVRLLGHIEFRDAMELHMAKQSLMILQGCGVSASGYQKIRKVTTMESKLDADARTKAAGIKKRRSVPRQLNNHRKALVPVITKLVTQQKDPYHCHFKEIQEQLKSQPELRGPKFKELRKLLKRRKHWSTHIKTLYLEQVTWNNEWNDIITTKTLENMTAADWQALCPDSPIKEHLPYLLEMEYKRLHQIDQRVRVKYIKKLGLTLPVLPTVKTNKDAMKNKMISAATLEDTDLAADLSDDELYELLAKDRFIYIGRPIPKDLRDKLEGVDPKADIRIHTIRQALISLLARTIPHNVFKLKQRTTIYFKDWTDGASILAGGFVNLTVSIIYNETYIRSANKFRFVTAPVPWLFGWFSETKHNLQLLREEFGAELKKHLAQSIRISINGKVHEFIFELLTSTFDHADDNKSRGNKCNGYKRCGDCDASFSKEDIPNLYSYQKMAKATQKDTETLFELLNADLSPTQLKAKLEALGLTCIDPLYNGDGATPLQARGIATNYRHISDNLHNITGLEKTLIKLEMEQKGFDKTGFETCILEKLHRAGIKQMKGAKWRLLIALHQVSIIPYVTQERQDLLQRIFTTLFEIQWIAYAHPKVQKLRGIRLRLHALCFILQCLIPSAYPKLFSKGALYCHTVISHFPRDYEVMDFMNASTEAGEVMFSQIKRILLAFSSRQKENALLELYSRWHYEQETKEYCGTDLVSDYKELKKATKQYKFQEIVITPDIWSKAGLSELLAFWSALKDFGYKKGEDFDITNDRRLEFTTLEDVKKALSDDYK